MGYRCTHAHHQATSLEGKLESGTNAERNGKYAGETEAGTGKIR